VHTITLKGRLNKLFDYLLKKKMFKYLVKVNMANLMSLVAVWYCFELK
jgi:hypothetical protein